MFGAPMFEPELFRKQIYCIEENTCNIFGTFRRPGNCAPFNYAPQIVGYETHKRPILKYSSSVQGWGTYLNITDGMDYGI